MLRARDTSVAAFAQQLDAYRAMTPGERVAIAAAMSDEIRVLAAAGIRDRHPAYTDAEVASSLAAILLGPAPGRKGRSVAARERAVTLTELLADVVRRLEDADVAYMVTGSVASAYHGEPRATRDLDIVIDPRAATLAALVESLVAGGYYVDRKTALNALRQRTQFNAIGPDATKVDFIIRKDRPFSREEFDRRRPADLLGTAAFITSLEDLIIAKLERSLPFDSDRQLRDVASMLAVSGDAVDLGYIAKWVRALGLEDAWQRIS